MGTGEIHLREVGDSLSFTEELSMMLGLKEGVATKTGERTERHPEQWKRAKQGAVKGLGLFMEIWKMQWGWRVVHLVGSKKDEPQGCLAGEVKNFGVYPVGQSKTVWRPNWAFKSRVVRGLWGNKSSLYCIVWDRQIRILRINQFSNFVYTSLFIFYCLKKPFIKKQILLEKVPPWATIQLCAVWWQQAESKALMELRA